MRVKAKIAVLTAPWLFVMGTSSSALAFQSAEQECDREVSAWCAEVWEQAGYSTQSACYYEQLTLACPGTTTPPGNPTSPYRPPEAPEGYGGNTRYCQCRLSCDPPTTPGGPTES